MARARNIKPGIFKNEILGLVDPIITLLFIGLWTLADKEGRLEDRPLRIKAETFPYRENLDINRYLTELHRLGFILRYQINKIDIIQVLNFKKHQSPHHTERDSELPEFNNESQITVKTRLDDGGNPPDSSIPDSSIPDSSIPDSSIPDSTTLRDQQAGSPIPFQKIIDLYHQKLPECRHMEKLTTKRKAQISARWKSGDLPDLETWSEYFDFVGQSRFLTGKTDPINGHKRFIADIEWITNETNFAKIYERKYHG